MFTNITKTLTMLTKTKHGMLTSQRIDACFPNDALFHANVCSLAQYHLPDQGISSKTSLEGGMLHTMIHIRRISPLRDTTQGTSTIN